MSSGLIVWVKVAADTDRAVELLKTRVEVAEVVPVDGRIKVLMVDHDTDHSFVAETLVGGGLKLVGLQEDELGLEEVFLRVTRGRDPISRGLPMTFLRIVNRETPRSASRHRFTY